MAIVDEIILERSGRLYEADIVDETGTAIPVSSLSTLTLKLYAERSLTVINGRDGQDVLNANNVTVDSAGHLEWIMQPADNAIVDTRQRLEIHVALFEFTYPTGVGHGKHEVRFTIKNLNKVP